MTTNLNNTILDEQIILKDEIEKEEQDIYSRIKNNLFNIINGKAGTGKTFTIRKLCEDNKNYAKLTSTTGIAAVNLGANAKTINSLFKYFDTKSLEQIYKKGILHWGLRSLRYNFKKIIIEECSMLDAQQLDILVDAILEVNRDKVATRENRFLGIDLVGDFLQLSPVKGEYCFKARNWPLFENNEINLTKIYRQDNLKFIEALDFIRGGNGKDGVVALKDCGVEFRNEVDKNFVGTTLISLNNKVDYFNANRLNELSTPMLRIQPKRRGAQLGEWDKNIPIEQRFKLNAYVMILANDVVDWNYVNGDCGFIVNYSKETETFVIRLKRTGKLVHIKKIKRLNTIDKTPDDKYFSSMFQPYVDFMSKEWVIGYIDYLPLRLAYASTVHKCQGLSLDMVQIDARDKFYGSYNMNYVALSRARSPENLVIVGSEKDVIEKTNIHPDVKRWV